MATYVVCYDLYVSGQKYACLEKKLVSYGTYWHAQGSVWFIRTIDSAEQVRNNLMACLDGNDKLIVAKLSGEAAWVGYAENISKWLKEQL